MPASFAEANPATYQHAVQHARKAMEIGKDVNEFQYWGRMTFGMALYRSENSADAEEVLTAENSNAGVVVVGGVSSFFRAMALFRKGKEDAVRYPQIGGTPGRPRIHPTKLYADAGYDSNATRELLMVMGIEPVIRRRNTPHGRHLGKVRWVVERTISWIKELRRMRIRHDHHPTIIDIWNHLALAAV